MISTRASQSTNAEIYYMFIATACVAVGGLFVAWSLVWSDDDFFF